MLARHWLFRVSVAINFLVLIYLALYSSSSSYPATTTLLSSSPPSSEQQQQQQQQSPGNNALNLNNLLISDQFIQSQNQAQAQNDPQLILPPANPIIQEPLISLSSGGGQNVEILKKSSETGGVINEEVNPQQLLLQQQQNGDGLGLGGVNNDDLSSGAGAGGTNNGGEVGVEISSGVNNNIVLDQGNLEPSHLHDHDSKSVNFIRKKAFPCDDTTPRSFYGQRGPFWVLYNYITASRTFGCDESITYTTHADFTFLDNLQTLVGRWQGPISLSLYCPGTDFSETLSRIIWLRECTSPLIKEYVNFHLFFDHKHIPKKKIPMHPMDVSLNCSAIPSPKFGENIITYKKAKKLPYPVNLSRNVARDMSSTHYILTSDIELYPNPNLIPDFLEMIRRNDEQLQRPNPKVFVLSIFEVEANVTRLPNDKIELIGMLKNKSAIPFHKYVCADCHRIPKSNEWLAAKYQPGMRVFHIGKRHKPFHHWEPIYIGTKLDPLYDERLTWEGRSDKMTQGYVLCVLDYEFHILDNAFLIHRPGIKRTIIIPSKNPVVAKQNSVIAKTILPELKLIYGTKPGCYV